jgi:hypothetical protein
MDRLHGLTNRRTLFRDECHQHKVKSGGQECPPYRPVDVVLEVGMTKYRLDHKALGGFSE